MDDSFKFTVIGRQKPQGSLSPFVSKTTGNIVTPQNKPLLAWRETVAAAAYVAMLRYGFTEIEPPDAVSIKIVFFIERPQVHYRSGKFSHLLKKSAPIFHTQYPDKDKLERAVLDAISGTAKKTPKIISDDALVIGGIVLKLWAKANQTHSTEVTITPIRVADHAMRDDGSYYLKGECRE